MLRAFRSFSPHIALVLLVAFTSMACSDTVMGGIMMPADAKGDIHFKGGLDVNTKTKDLQSADDAEDAGTGKKGGY